MTTTNDTSLLSDPRRQAALLFWQGYSVPQIAEQLQVKRTTVQSWKQRDKWEETAPLNRVEFTLEARLIQLYAKPDLTAHDFKVADFLARQMERLARVNRYGQTGNEADLNPNVVTATKGKEEAEKELFQRRGYRETRRDFPRAVFRLSARVVARGAGAPHQAHSEIATDWRDVLFCT